MPKGPLPGYVWDERLSGGRYREVLADGRLGRIVSQKQIVSDLATVSDKSAGRFAQMAADAVNGAISPRDFYGAMRYELKDLYNSTSALARGGWTNMDAAAWGRNGQILRDEYQYLAGFAQDIADGKLTEAQARSRAELYAGKAYSRYWAEDVLVKQDGGMSEYRWNDTKDEAECGDCPTYAAQGWVPIGTFDTVPGAGDTACLGHCRCELEYR